MLNTSPMLKYNTKRQGLVDFDPSKTYKSGTSSQIRCFKLTTHQLMLLDVQKPITTHLSPCAIPASSAMSNQTNTWLVVSTPLTNMSQLGWLFPIYGKITAMFQTTNQIPTPRYHEDYIRHFAGSTRLRSTVPSCGPNFPNPQGFEHPHCTVATRAGMLKAMR